MKNFIFKLNLKPRSKRKTISGIWAFVSFIFVIGSIIFFIWSTLGYAEEEILKAFSFFLISSILFSISISAFATFFRGVFRKLEEWKKTIWLLKTSLKLIILFGILLFVINTTDPLTAIYQAVWAGISLLSFVFVVAIYFSILKDVATTKRELIQEINLLSISKRKIVSLVLTILFGIGLYFSFEWFVNFHGNPVAKIFPMFAIAFSAMLVVIFVFWFFRKLKEKKGLVQVSIFCLIHASSLGVIFGTFFGLAFFGEELPFNSMFLLCFFIALCAGFVTGIIHGIYKETKSDQKEKP